MLEYSFIHSLREQLQFAYGSTELITLGKGETTKSIQEDGIALAIPAF